MRLVPTLGGGATSDLHMVECSRYAADAASAAATGLRPPPFAIEASASHNQTAMRHSTVL